MRKQEVKTEKDIKNEMIFNLIVKAIKGVIPTEFRKEKRDFFKGRSRNFDKLVRNFVIENGEEILSYSMACIDEKTIEDLKECEEMEGELFDDDVIQSFAEDFKKFINDQEIKNLSEKV